MNINAYIKELLTDHDCVILEGIGGFVATYQGAKIHPVTHFFSPPSKKIAFNQQLKTNDGLLLDYIAAIEQGADKTLISENINAFLSQIQEKLNGGEKYVFDEIGTIFKNKEQNIEFQPAKDSFPTAEAYGLSEFFARPIERQFKPKHKTMSTQEEELTPKPIGGEQEQAVPTRPVVRKKVEEPKQKKAKKGVSAIWFIIPIVLLLSLGGGGYYMYTTQKEFNLSSLNPMKLFGSKPTVEEPEEVESVWAEEAQDSTATTEEVPAEEAEPVAEESNFSSERTISSATNRYYVIAGAFENPDNAQKFRQKLENDGYDSKVLEPIGEKNVHRVTIADFSTQADGLSKVDAENSNFGNALWVLKY